MIESIYIKSNTSKFETFDKLSIIVLYALLFSSSIILSIGFELNFLP